MPDLSAVLLGGKVPNRVFGLVLRALVSLRLYRLTARLFALLIHEIPPNTGTVPNRTNEGRATLLALSAEEFREDPKLLAETGRFRVLTVDSGAQRRLMYRFYPANAQWHHVLSHALRPDLDPHRRGYRAFLRAFLPHLYRRLGVSAVIGSHIHFGTDVDWGAVSNELGFPYVVLHRENLFASDWIIRQVTDRLGVVQLRFEGERIVVHNDVVKRVFAESGYASPNTIEVLGCTRMDEYLSRLRNGPGSSIPGRRKVAFFPISLGDGHSEFLTHIRPSIERLHIFLVDFARRNPDIDVIIKPKAKWSSSWQADFDTTLAKSPAAGPYPSNLIVRSDLDVHELILSSSAVLGINTTTLIEAGIAGQRTVIPYFPELRDPWCQAHLLFGSYFPSLLVARDEEELEREIFRGLRGERLPDAMRKTYEEIFQTYVSSLRGDATARYVTLLDQVCRTHAA